MCINRRNFIKTAGMLGACALCGGLHAYSYDALSDIVLKKSDFPTNPYKNINELPKKIKIDACNNCQLNCPKCWRVVDAKKIKDGSIPLGYLSFKNFKKFVDTNKVDRIELSDNGEVFLNPELLEIMQYAHKKGVILSAHGGVNGNTISDEQIKALVDYKFSDLDFSIDGASQDVYSIYRRGGNFDQVIENIKKINAYKAKRNSVTPEIKWQYILFGHNIHEIPKAKEIAQELNIQLLFKKNYAPHYSPIAKKDKEFVNEQTSGIFVHSESPVITRKLLCGQMWTTPQINWNGDLLGCAVNNTKIGVNVFETDLMTALNHPDFINVKKMVTGEIPVIKGSECSKCWVYKDMKKNNSWLSA